MNVKCLEMIYEHLADDESKKIFDSRFEYSIKRDRLTLLESMSDNNKRFRNMDITSIRDQSKGRRIIIYGAGREGRYTAYILEHSEISGQVVAFADGNSKIWGSKVGKYDILSPFELQKWRDSLIVIASIPYGIQMYQDIAKTGFPQENIFFPPFSRVAAETGWQYFDVFKPDEKEVFIDAGCYDGQSSIDFATWCGGKYEKIIALEADKEMIRRCKDKIERADLKNYNLINKACWLDKCVIGFDNNVSAELQGSSRIDNMSFNKVNADSIDNIMNGERVSFIKMDIEGAELEGLKGARKTITTYHPKLAICVYHKPEDIYEIPAYILQIAPTYKFILRHYTSDLWETVLYAQ